MELCGEKTTHPFFCVHGRYGLAFCLYRSGSQCDYIGMGIKAVYRLVILMLGALVAFSAAVSYVGWRNMREENTELELSRQRLAEQKQNLSDEKAYKEEYFNRLLYDDDFAARKIREKLGLARPDEIVFRFEDSTPTAADSEESSAPILEAGEPEMSAEQKAERDGASDLRKTLFERIFLSLKDSDGEGDETREADEAGEEAEPSVTETVAAGGGSASEITPQAERTESKSGGEVADKAEKRPPAKARREGGIKMPSGTKPIIFRNI